MTFTRVRALLFVGLLVLAAAVVAAVVMAKDSQRDAAVAACPADWPRANMALSATRDIVVAVFDGARATGTAATVAGDFRDRGFQVRPLRKAGEPEKVAGVAVLRYGPDAVGAAHVVRAYFLGKATMDYDAGRRGGQIDVVIGERFQSLAQPTDVNIALADLGHPKVPPGACARA
jgi:hypothetical protein